MLKVQFVSDLHLEFITSGTLHLFDPVGDILILAGDIVPGAILSEMKKFIRFLQIYAPKYMHVIHVPGNHEFWSKTTEKSAVPVQEISSRFRALSRIFPNYHFMTQGIFNITHRNKEYAFIGATLWTHIPKENQEEIKKTMRDYEYIWVKTKAGIRRLLPEDTSRYHAIQSRFITKAVSTQKNKNIILITHHKPTKDLDRGVAYETDKTTTFLVKPIRLAIHGHTHVLYDKLINGVRVVSNPKGYHDMQDTGFRKNWIIKL